MTQIIMIHDLVDQTTGKTFKEMNLEKQHDIPLGSLVEINSEDGDDDCGVRLYVIGHVRDCDGTPLYRLGLKDAPLHDSWRSKDFYSYASFGNYPKQSLIVIK